MKSNDLSIIIYSCWKNRDMWEVFSRLFQKYWADCPYSVILATDKYNETDESYVFDRILPYDDTWAKMIKNVVKEAGTPYVMLWMDDYLLCDYVSNADIERQLDRAKKYNAANLRLVEMDWTVVREFEQDKGVAECKRGSAYSMSTQVGIWDSSFLEKIIKDEWSAWDFERIGSLSTEYEEQPILVSLDYEFPYEEGVRQGKWMVQGAKLCRRNGIRLDTSVRPIMSNMDMAKIYFKGAILDMNPTLVLKVQNFVNKCKYILH